MIRKLLSATCLAFVASSMALADPPPGKGKPDKGDGGAFVPAFMISGGRPGGSLRFANEDASSFRTIADFGGGGSIAVSTDAGTILGNENRSIVMMDYSIDASGNVSVSSRTTLLAESGEPGNDDWVAGGSCVAVASTGHAAYSSTLGLFLRDLDGSQLLVVLDVPSCAYVRGTDRLIAAVRGQGTVTFVELSPEGVQSQLGTIQGDIAGLDAVENESQLRLLVSRAYDLKYEVVEWEPGQDIDENAVIEAGNGGQYTCELDSDGWPNGTVYKTTSGIWIERTNTRRAIFGTKGNRQPAAVDPAC